MFILLDETSIYTVVDLAFHLVDGVMSGRVRTPLHNGLFKVRFEFEVPLHQFFARQGRGQCCYLLMSLLGLGSELRLCYSSAWTLLFPFSCFLCAY